MEPTIEPNDRVMVNKLAYRIGDIERGDVVVFLNPLEPESDESIPEAVIRSVLEAVGVRTRGHDDLIKRVIGLPGETVEVVDGEIQIDGAAISEEYTDGSFMPDSGPFPVADGEIFVMGDNRDDSFDSRRFGPVPISHVIGRAFVVIWPLSNFSGL
jgi:signal peptidase I